MIEFIQMSSSIHFQQLISSAMLIERILHPLHDGEDLFLFQSPSDNLYSHGQTGHLLRIV